MTIPENVKSIDKGAFIHCENLESITILNPDCAVYDSRDTICNYITYGGVPITKYSGIIRGYENSTAQAYAEKYGYDFRAIGDANGDGKVTVADAVMIQNFISGKSELTDRQACDLCQDGKIDSFDLCLLKKMIIQNQ